MEKTVKGENAAFTIILGAQDQYCVFYGHDQRKSPNHQGHATQQILRRSLYAVAKDLIHRVKRRRADVAKYDAQRSDRQCRKVSMGRVVRWFFGRGCK